METKLWTKNFINITIINLLLFFGFQIMLATLPLHVKLIGGTDSIVGWISGAATIASVLVRPFAGMILDKFNRKTVLIFGIIIIIGITLSYGFISVLGLILVIRFVHGIGWGIASTASNTVATEVIPKSRFGEGMGYFGLSSSLAMSVAPALALSLLNLVGFQKISLLSMIIGLLALISTLIFQYKGEDVKQIPDKKTSLYEIASITPSIIMFFVTASYGTIVGFISIYSAERGIANIGLFFTVFAISVLVIRPFAGKVMDKFGHKFIVFPGLILLICSLLILSYSSELLLFLFCAVLYGVGFGAVQSCLQTMAVASVPKERRGAATATFYTGFDAGIGLGSIFGGIIASMFGYSRMYQIFSLFLIIAILVYVVSNKKEEL